MRHSLLIFASLVTLAAGCRQVTKPTDDSDPCADGGTSNGKIVCDGLPPITDSLGDYADEEEDAGVGDEGTN